MKKQIYDDFDQVFYETELKEAYDWKVDHAKKVIEDLDALLRKGRQLPPKDRLSVQLAIEIIREEYHI